MNIHRMVKHKYKTSIPNKFTKMNKRKLYFDKISSKFNNGKIYKTTYNRVIEQSGGPIYYEPVRIEGCNPQNHDILLNILRATSIEIVNTLEYIRRSKSLVDLFTTIPDGAIKSALKKDKNIDLDDHDSFVNQESLSLGVAKRYIVFKTSSTHNRLNLLVHSTTYSKWIVGTTPIMGYRGTNTCMGKYLAFMGYDASIHKGNQTPYYSKEFKYMSEPLHYWSHEHDVFYGSFDEWMLSHWMIYFEVFGYRVVDGNIVKADQKHMEKFKKTIKKVRLTKTKMRFNINSKQFEVYVGKTQKPITPLFVPIAQYVLKKLLKEQIVTQPPTRGHVYGSSRATYIFRVILSNILPPHIIKAINKYHITEQLLGIVNKQATNQSKTIKHIKNLINNGAVLDTSTLPFFNYNGQSHVIRSINSGNILIADFFIENFGDLFSELDTRTPNIPHIFKKYFAKRNKLRESIPEWNIQDKSKE